MRDNLTISCDISGCTHATTHTLDVPMSIVQSRKARMNHSEVLDHQGLRSGGRLSGGNKLAHVFANFCMTV